MTITSTEPDVIAGALADHLRRLADMVEANETVAEVVATHIRRSGDWDTTTRLLLPVNHCDDSLAAMRAFIRTALDAGAQIEKAYDDTWGAVNVLFPGGLCLYVYASRAEVCERVVKGTREVTKEVPDAEALKAVPRVTVTETVEDVEWVCKPILAGEQVSA